MDCHTGYTALHPTATDYLYFVADAQGHSRFAVDLKTHNANVHGLLVEFFAVAELVSIAFFGELNQYLRDWIAGRDGVALNVAL